MVTGTIAQLRQHFKLNGFEIKEPQFINFIATLETMGIAKVVADFPRPENIKGRPPKILTIPDEFVISLTPK